MVALRVMMMSVVLACTPCSLVRMGMAEWEPILPVERRANQWRRIVGIQYAGFTPGLSAEWFLTPTIAVRTDPTIRFTTLGAEAVLLAVNP